ncbi:MAG: hypothetical protein ABSB69_16255 [Solirubrobacteraceae bacterium]
MRGIGHRAGRHGAVALIGVLALVLPAGASALKLSNPPSLAGSGFSLKIRGGSGAYNVYLSPRRTLVRGDVSLGRATVRRGKLAVRIHAGTRPGVYYVLLCKGRGRRSKCVGAKTVTVVLPKVRTVSAGVTGTASLAAGSASSGTIAAGGGTLTATGPDGTRYALAYDAGALVPGTQVTLVPIGTFSAPGAGRLAGGVEIEPAGLTFASMTVLVITPAHPVPPSARHAVTFTGTGQNLYSVPLLPRAAPVAIGVGVSGGYALLSGGSALSARVAGARGGPLGRAALANSAGYAGFYEPLLAGLAQDSNIVSNNEQSDAATAFLKTAGSLLEEWYTDIKSNLIPAGLQSDEAAELATQELARWGQAGSLLLGDGSHNQVTTDGQILQPWDGMSAQFGPNWDEQYVKAPSRKVVGSVYNRAQEECASEHDLTKIQKIISWERIDQLYGQAEVPYAEMLACEQFVIEFESKMVDNLLGQGEDPKGQYINNYTAHVRAKPETVDTSTFPLSGSNKGNYSEATGHTEQSHECNEEKSIEESTEERGSGDTFNVVSLTVPNGYANAGAGPPAITFEIGKPSEILLVKQTPELCGAIPQSSQVYFWFADWVAQHKGAILTSGVSGLAFKIPLQTGSSSVVAYENFNDRPFAKENAESVETTTITVTQSPGYWNKL